MIGKIAGHLKTICRHKLYVAKYCFKAGMYWQGIMHDMSKFSPVEFFESVKYFTEGRSSVGACKKTNGISMAWMHHKGRNMHHYEFWQDRINGKTFYHDMPFKYAMELVCDYLGAAEAYMGDSFSLKAEYDWWKKHTRRRIAMSEQTFFFVDEMLFTLAEENNTDVLRKERAFEIYHKHSQKRSTYK